jgi:membrane protein
MRRLIERARSSIAYRVVDAFGASRATYYASALAFAGFLAMFPMILGILSVIGLAISDRATEARFQTLILQMFPASAQSELLNAIHGVKQSAGWMGLVSLVGLLWAASGIFSTLEFVLSQVFGTKQRSLPRQKLMGFLLMLFLVAAIAITLGANAIAAFFPYAWVTSFLVGATVMVALLVVLYRFVPNRAFKLRDVLPGALLAGVLTELLSLGFPLYARIAGGFNTYGAQFGLFFLLATWLFLLSELILLGAVYNRVRLEQPSAEAAVRRRERRIVT